MNDKSNTEKTAFGMSKEEFQQTPEKQERSKPFEDEALEKFVKEPVESDLLCNMGDKIISSVNFMLLFSFLCVILAFSIISKSIPSGILSMLGIIILLKEAKRNDNENNKKYK